MPFQDIPVPLEEKPTKQEYAVATYLKKNCPTKKTKFLNHQVQYFYGKLFQYFNALEAVFSRMLICMPALNADSGVLAVVTHLGHCK